jgi:peptidoglycan hydrolase CwlO-like protein
MIDKMLSLKNTKPWLFYILLPVLAIFFIFILLSKINVSGAKKDVKKADLKDEKLKEEQDRAEGAANQLTKEIDQIENKIEKIESTDDADWHKKV